MGMFTQLMAIPIENPVFKREISNHMYTAHSYFWSKVAICSTIMWIYPVIVTLVSFYCFQWEASSFSDFLIYMMSLFGICFCGAFLGLMCGTFTSSLIVAILFGNLTITLLNFGAGCMSNTGETANPIIKFVSWISPMHYGCQILFK